MYRIVGKLSNETDILRKARLNTYVAAMDRAAKQLSTFEKTPKLRDVSVENQGYWKRISHVARFLPGRARKVRAAVLLDQKHPGLGATELKKEMLETVLHVVAALVAIRNCQP